MVEQRTVNARVVGSSPTCGANSPDSSNLQRSQPARVTAWEHLLEFGQAFLRDTLVEFRERDVVEVF